MHRRRFLSLVALASLMAVACKEPAIPVAAGPAALPGEPPRRVISLAPSITEFIYALGEGGRLVGVTRYCRYPEQARLLPQVGGYLDPSTEAIVSLKPDLVLLLQEQQSLAATLQRLGIKTMTLDHDGSLAGVMASPIALGAVLHCPERAAALQESMSAPLRALEARLKTHLRDRPRPRVLVCLGRESGQPVSLVFASGASGYYADVLQAAGAVNAYAGTLAVPQLGREGLQALNPDFVIEVVAETDAAHAPELMKAQWDEVGLAAIAAGRYIVLSGQEAVIPGPRSAQLVLRLAQELHPELGP